MQLTSSHNYQDILLNSSGLLDVRAPIEFAQGAFPNAANLPLLDDAQRHEIGLKYKQAGKDKAIALGHSLIQGATKQSRIEQWTQYAQQNKNSYLYCLRGGLRSEISQHWLHESGVSIPRVAGGYKALRKFLINELTKANKHFSFILVGGLTGCRKTSLIKSLNNGIDLEGAAHHRGSSFGAHAIPQNTQINFENKLAIDLLRARHAKRDLLTLEDEGKFIGSIDIPKNIYTEMRCSPIVVVERSIEDRLEQVFKEYIVGMQQEFIQLHSQPEKAFAEFSNYLTTSLQRIKKRLGMQQWQTLNQELQSALKQHQITNQAEPHTNWLEPLLKNYYDPMYSSQLNNRSEHIVFRGDFNACQQYLKDLAQQN